MRTNDVLGIIFANVHDDMVNELTHNRSMASIPIGGRYRMIDFPLSNMVNAGISTVGVITNNNYHSLMDHLGAGKPWDLDRKAGGLFILPPYNNEKAGRFSGHIDSLGGVLNFINHSNEKYVVMCDSDVIGNFDLEKIIESHKEKGADVTVAYKHGPLPKSHRDIMSFRFDQDGRADEIRLSDNIGVTCPFSLDVFVIDRNLLINLVHSALETNATSLSREVFMPLVKKLKIYGYEIKETAWVIDSTESFVKANFKLLECETRREIFTAERPIYTKTRDDVPTRYGLNAVAHNSLIADGCVIEGTVKNCILFRGVKVASGAVLENCIIMQDSVIGKNARLSFVTTDKNVEVSEDRVLCGAPTHSVFIKKSAKV